MSQRKIGGVLPRVSFSVFGVLGLVFFPLSVAVVLDDPSSRIVPALMGVLCAAALEIASVRVGSVAHRSPSIALPVLAVPALTPVLPGLGIVGIVMFGVFVVLLVEARRLNVSVYSASLAGIGTLFYLLITTALDPAPDLLSVAAACVGYALFVLAAEMVRMRLTNAPADRGGRLLVSPVRLFLVLIGLAILCMASVHWSQVGLPTPGEGRTSTETAAGTLLGSIVVALVFIGWRAMRDMRRRINGLMLGSNTLSATRRFDTAEDVAEALCHSTASAVGVQSVVMQAEPARAGEIGVAVNFSGQGQFLVARRDIMDAAFTGLDRRTLKALAATAELAVQASQNLVGLTERANTDSLTGLPNYGAFQEALETINGTRSDAEAIAVLFIDLDAFKRLNDTHGHQAGDEVLRVVGQRMRQAVRPHDVVARVGGDEFVIILTRLSTRAETSALAEIVLAAATLPIAIGAVTINPRLSIGLAYSPRVETDVAELVRDADHSMLSIKKARRRGTPAAASSIHFSEHRSSRFDATVALAIDSNMLELAYQPVVSLVTSKIWAFEALLRYVDPEFGAISPTVLVEKAKSIGRFDLLTRQVAQKAMAAAAEFQLAEPAVVCMAVNVDAEQIAPERLGGFFEDLSAQYPGISLCLEFNERSAVRVSPEIRIQANRLRDLDILIALDDYGSVDSSVDSLVRVPMDILKIDRSLVDDLADIRQREVLTALQNFGDKLEFFMIVEGVENAQMADQLARLGIRSAQGFHFGIPRSFADTIERLDEFGSQAVVPGQTRRRTPAI